MKDNRRLIFKTYPKPLVSIIIPVYNQWEYTFACLKSILENTEGIFYEVIVADDKSNDKTSKLLKYVKGVTHIRNKKNLLFLLNCNNAAKYAEGKYIYFLNNDTIVKKDWLKYLLDTMENYEKAGLVGSKLIYQDGRLQEAGGIIWNDGSGYNYGRYDDPEKAEYNYLREVDYCSGAGILVRSDLWKKLGGFDESFAPAYYEDTDLAFSIRKLGYKTIYQPKSEVIHFEGVSHGTDLNDGIKSYQAVNQKKFYDKWKNILKRDHYSGDTDVFIARERQKKKVVLVIDNMVPQWDKHAGGRTTYLYLKFLIETGYRVIFVPDNFYQSEPYTNVLQQMGIEVIYGTWHFHNFEYWLEAYGRYIDISFLHRPHIALNHIEKIKRFTKSKILYFCHDLHFLREQRRAELENDDNILKLSKSWKETEFRLFKECDIFYTPSYYEKEIVIENFTDKNDEKQINKVKVLPLNYFDKIPVVDNGLSFEERKGIMFVGGFNHLPNQDGINWFINEIFPDIIVKNTDIIFYIIGSNPPDTLKNTQNKNIRVIGYVSDDELAEYYKNCRVVVAPLRYGAGMKGKVIEAMAFGVPQVTTSIGAEGLVDLDKEFKIADTPKNFAKDVLKLYKNKNSWIKSQKDSMRYMIKHFSKDVFEKVIAEDFHR